MFNLQQFFDPSHTDCYLNKPFNYSGRTYACNGFRLLSVPIISGHQELPIGHKIMASLDKLNSIIDANTFIPLPKRQQTIEVLTCPCCDGAKYSIENDCLECEGAGVVYFSNDHSHYECACKTCEGVGVEYVRDKNRQFICRNCSGLGQVTRSSGKSVNVGQSKISETHLLLLESQQNVLFTAGFSNNTDLVFKVGDQHGIIMGIRRWD